MVLDESSGALVCRDQLFEFGPGGGEQLEDVGERLTTERRVQEVDGLGIDQIDGPVGGEGDQAGRADVEELEQGIQVGAACRHRNDTARYWRADPAGAGRRNRTGVGSMRTVKT